MNNAILLQSGEFYSFTNPEDNVWTIEDIADALSKICRFGGHVHQHYSVAQHSYYVSYAIDQQYALDGLLHDAAEAFLCDIPKPLKKLLPCYQELEVKHEAELFKQLGIAYPLHPAVHAADVAVFKAEVRDMKPKHTHWDYLSSVQEYAGAVEPWPAKVAAEVFLFRYAELMDKRTRAESYCVGKGS